MINLKEYDSTPNLTPVSSTTSVSSLDFGTLVSKNTFNEMINEIYEDKPYIKYNRFNSFTSLHIRRITLINKLFPNTFIERSDTSPF